MYANSNYALRSNKRYQKAKYPREYKLMKDQTHIHRDIPKHSQQQAAMFFSLSSQLGYKAEEVKQRAIKACGVECFNELTPTHLNYLIDKLLERQQQRGGEENDR